MVLCEGTVYGRSEETALLRLLMGMEAQMPDAGQEYIKLELSQPARPVLDM